MAKLFQIIYVLLNKRDYFNTNQFSIIEREIFDSIPLKKLSNFM